MARQRRLQVFHDSSRTRVAQLTRPFAKIQVAGARAAAHPCEGMGLIEESDELHERVQAFADGSAEAERFDSLALAIARFQCARSPGYARLVARHGSTLDSVASIPAVPTQAFRLSRVAVHPESLDAARFRTSGTTAEQTGVHALRRLDTYRTLSVASGRRALASSLGSRPLVVALAQRPVEPPRSSLSAMMQFFVEAFEGLECRTPERWLVDAGGVDVAGLGRAIERARVDGRPLLVLATAFALAAVLETAKPCELACPAQTLVMVTGGFKGRTRAFAPEPFKQRLAELFALAPERIVGEYGMTELTSQLYEGTAPGARLSGPSGVYLEPPWLKVLAVDAVTLRPV